MTQMESLESTVQGCVGFHCLDNMKEINTDLKRESLKSELAYSKVSRERKRGAF